MQQRALGRTCSTGPVVCAPSAMLLNFSLASLPAAAAPCSVPPRCSGDSLRSCQQRGQGMVSTTVVGSGVGRAAGAGGMGGVAPAQGCWCRRPPFAAAAALRHLLSRDKAGLQPCSALQALCAAARPQPGVLAHLDGRGSASSAILGGHAAHSPLGDGAGADRRGGAGSSRALHHRLPGCSWKTSGVRPYRRRVQQAPERLLQLDIACAVLCFGAWGPLPPSNGD